MLRCLAPSSPSVPFESARVRLSAPRLRAPGAIRVLSALLGVAGLALLVQGEGFGGLGMLVAALGWKLGD